MIRLDRVRSLALLLGLPLLGGCSGPAVATELVVVVASDYAPGDEIGRIVIDTRDDAGAVIATEDVTIAASAGNGALTLPFSFGVTPSGPSGRPLRIEVAAYELGATDPFVTRRAIAPFIVGERRRLVVYLERACERVACDATTTCVHGACVLADVPIASLEGVTPGSELAVDAGPPITVDGGAPRVCADDPSCDGARHVEVGDGFACAVRRTSGRIACWGTEAALGQLGDGTSTPSRVPVGAVGIADATELALSDRTACAMSETQLWCWGDNALGQLGAGDGASATTPTAVSLVLTRLYAGASTICASGGPTQCWGGGIAGASLVLADDCAGTPCARRPTEQTSLELLDAIADEGHSCVVRGAALACAGANTFGEVGDGTRDARESLTMVPGLATVWSVATTMTATCAISATVPPDASDAISTTFCWGAGSVGQLGGTGPDRCGDAPCALSPLALSGVEQPIEVAGTRDTFCARLASGAVLCWGSDEDGRLGDGVGAPDKCTTPDGSQIRCALAPTPVRALDAIDLDGRGGAFCAARRDGGVSCWGRGYGELAIDVGSLPP